MRRAIVDVRAIIDTWVAVEMLFCCWRCRGVVGSVLVSGV